MTVQKRLKWCMKHGNLRVSDLARWFVRRHSTVRGWVVDGKVPGGTEADIEFVEIWLTRLETKIARKTAGFPVPRLSPAQRIKHLAAVRRA